MPRQFGTIAFTPAVKAMQEKMGSRENYERFVAKGADNNTINPDLEEFISGMEGFYLGTVSSNGYPYIQFRGGKAGFLKILNERTLGFADFRGNVQYISVGNLSENDKAFLFLMDYRHRRRLKIIGRARIVEDDPVILAQVQDKDYDATVERAIIFEVEGWDWNCPQHIPIRYSEAEVEAMQLRIRELEELLAEARNMSQ
ncbi:pyridoxamine 5'-phosphate oxidase family protein [Anabaena cylindrica FACHB-243]|uniref:Pyridoxamine 5'-phosphate oxidase-related FMN-binding protein n=1 Tax=Anabaena cylindrica (strain ATCC 27899 / PCC 7122) TaxID=272123 RepID=K9ZCX9_ANACC|nr:MULTISPECIES: pyridoxamine 5'-phosphate oxidase family protein [Anabaena]AFZ57083.1 pyridoxamine 5'-phosphate oxidase-related FMN-binding protein [Anabaena cylindrica PCC 7122]MBD2421441.1 pyridoxamine 5'-phosphate oxidase family protein [Anabaena cylindrica FACHB-243]MBY5283152.1 pyridoxamine 5'-phosphate oxidase family protein [Anabaena sp. CCAP 1446/1C]MBY5309128.1 pyridoxamine 5'-phosphate oxidase family protein [Anabaena sp. CCAP 1446/1C]MCM2407798.1 pyridoxamine 5'-phosphate oxidase f